MILRKLIVYISLIALIVLIALLSQTAQKYDVKYRIEKIVLENNSIVPTSEILKFARIGSEKELKGLSPEIVIDRIEKHPYVKSAEGNFLDSITLSIKVKEVEPFALILCKESMLCLTADGKVIPFNSSIKMYDLPLITGVSTEAYLKPISIIGNSELSAAFEILHALEEIDFAFFSLLSEIEITGKDQYCVYLTKPQARIILNKNFDFKKGIQLSEFWRQVILNQNLIKYEYIDLRFEDQIVVKEKKFNQLTELI
jgi:cell division protein FtsQ